MSEQRAKASTAVPALGLFFDRHGRWWHDATEVRHARLSGLLDRSVARAEDGSLIVTTGRDRLPFASEDAPVFARSAHATSTAFSLELSTGARWTPEVGTRFFIDGDGHARVPSPDRRFWMLLSRSATQALLGHLLDVDDENGAFHLELPQGRCALVESGPRDWSAAPALSGA